MENILVYIEIKEKITNHSQEVLTKARKLARETNRKLTALAIGENILEQAKESIDYGVEKLIYSQDQKLKNFSSSLYAKILINVIKKEKPYLVLIPASENGCDLAGAIAAKLDIGVAAHSAEIKITEDGQDVKFIRPSYDGKSISDIRLITTPKITTVGEGVFLAQKSKAEKIEIEEEKFEMTEEDKIIEILGTINTTKSRDLEEAKIIVAGGLGVEQPKNWHIITDLAEELNAAVTGSKPISDQLWIPADQYVGISGLKVRPKLYIAIGISGSAQHQHGMRDSDIIIAINKDENAPIFKIAHYKIVGDLFEIVPALTEKLKELKKKN